MTTAILLIGALGAVASDSLARPFDPPADPVHAGAGHKASERSIRFAARLLSGHAVLRVVRDEDGHVARHILSVGCRVPGETSEQRKERLRRTTAAKQELWAKYLRQAADTDQSADLTAQEAEDVNRAVYFGLTLAQLPEVRSSDELASLLHEEPKETAMHLAAYAKLAATATRDGVEGLSPLREGFALRSDIELQGTRSAQEMEPHR